MTLTAIEQELFFLKLSDLMRWHLEFVKFKSSRLIILELFVQYIID
jgi:hypothetical protein